MQLGKVAIHAEREGLWLTIDVERVPNVVNAFAEALAHVIDVLRPPAEEHAFDRYVLDLVWGRVHLVPLVRGKSLERKTWSLDIVTLPRPEERSRKKTNGNPANSRRAMASWTCSVAAGVGLVENEVAPRVTWPGRQSTCARR